MNLEELKAKVEALGFTDFKFQIITPIDTSMTTDDGEYGIDRQTRYLSVRMGPSKFGYSYRVPIEVIGASRLTISEFESLIFKQFLNSLSRKTGAY